MHIECLAECGQALETLARRDAVAWSARHHRMRFWPLVAHFQDSCPDADIRLPETPRGWQSLLSVPLPLWSRQRADGTFGGCVSDVSPLKTPQPGAAPPEQTFFSNLRSLLLALCVPP